MNKEEKIESWKSPKWHKDFGNPTLELSLLKKISLEILSLESAYDFELDCYEEGYMNVNVSVDDRTFVEIHVAEVDINKVGLFFEDGREIYVNDVKDIATHFRVES